MPDRRTFIKSGIVLTGASMSVAQGRAASATGPPAILSPNQTIPEDAEVRLVEPFADVPIRQLATPESWITHQFCWWTVGEEDASDLEDILNAATHRFAIDDVKIPNPDQYRSDIEKRRDGTYYTLWDFSTRPRPVGEHTFEVEITFDSPVRSKQTPNEDRVWEGTYEHEGTYEVRHEKHTGTELIYDD